MALSAPPIMSDSRQYSEFIVSWVPNGGVSPNPTLIISPPGVTIVRTGVGLFNVGLPAYYTNALVTRLAFFTGYQRASTVSVLPAITGSIVAGVPAWQISTSNFAGAATDFTTADVTRFFMLIYLKYNSFLEG